jgi:3-oxoacyl-[acyl-carrier-protein] synthase-3
MANRHARIAGWGMYVPERILGNAELERMVDTSDDWIRTRSGIRERRLAAEAEATSDLADPGGARGAGASRGDWR